MFKVAARTIARSARVRGRGLHSGTPVEVTLHPAAAGAGICFGPVRVGLDTAWARPGHSGVGPVATTEHLLAAVLHRRITDLRIEVHGAELPGLDGSAQPWAEALGRTVCTGVTEGIELPVVDLDGVRTRPGRGLSVWVDLGPPYRGHHRWRGDLGARTPALHRDQPSPYGQGLDDANLLGPRGPLVPQRMPAEWAQHKLLDLLGDLALFGCPVRGAVHARRGTHVRHLAAFRACARVRSRSG